VATWTENQEFHAAASLAVATAVSDNIDLATGSYDYGLITIKLTWTDRKNAAAKVEFLRSPDSGTTTDTEGHVEDSTLHTLRPDSGSLIYIRSFVVAEPWITVRVTNCGVAAVTYQGLYAARQFISV